MTDGMMRERSPAAPGRSRGWWLAALAPLGSFLIIRPWVREAFPVWDFAEVLPLLRGSHGIWGAFHSIADFYRSQGRANYLCYLQSR